MHNPQAARFLVVFVLLVLLGTFNMASGEPIGTHPLVLPATTQILLDQGVEFLLEDSAQPWTAPDAARQSGWQAYGNKVLNFRQEKKAVWLRFQIHNPRKDTDRWLLISDWPLLDELRLQTRTPEQTEWTPPEYTGDKLPVAERSVPHRLPVLSLTLPAQATTEVYLRVQSHNTLLMPLTLMEAGHFQDWDRQQDALLAAFFSIVLVMLCYNACLFSLTRDTSYLFYCWYVGGIVLFELVVTGAGNAYLWHSFPWMLDRSYPVTAALAFVGASLFLRYFLQLKRYGGWLLHINSSFVAYWWIALVLGALDVTFVSDIQDLMAMNSCIAGLGTTIYLWRHGNVSARYFTIAWSFLIIATFFFAASVEGWVERSATAQYSQMLGFVLEVILLSFALAERINRERAAREEAQQSALALSQQVARERDEKVQSQNALINLQKRTNEDLEIKVIDRTAELQRTMNNLEIANRELSKLSHTDALTHVSNRRYFDTVFAEEIRRANRAHQPLSLLLIDIDHFKKVNDQHGHLAGDECLRMVANAISLVVNRGSDLVARYGGEEFGVLLPFTETGCAMTMAETIRQEVQSIKMIHQGKQIWMSVSIGVAGWIPARNEPAEKLIASADTALYQAKNAGRNQTRLMSSA